MSFTCVIVANQWQTRLTPTARLEQSGEHGDVFVWSNGRRTLTTVSFLGNRSFTAYSAGYFGAEQAITVEGHLLSGTVTNRAKVMAYSDPEQLPALQHVMAGSEAETNRD